MSEISVSDLLHLSVAERIQLAEDLWDSIATEATNSDALPITDEQRIELDRRLADYEADPGASIPWGEARARLLGPR